MARSSNAGSSSQSLLALFFFFSGALAVIYEVVWQRQFALVFGSAAPATAAVLAAYFAGLGAGSLMVGRLASRWRRPLRVYASLELGIAIGALLVTPILGLLASISSSFSASLGDSLVLRAVLKSVLAWLALALPTFCMGGTLPVLADFVDRGQRHFGITAGLLYMTNTFGAGIGALAAPFALLPSLGLSATTLACVVGNLGLAFAALALDRRTGVEQRAAPNSNLSATGTTEGRSRASRIGAATSPPQGSPVAPSSGIRTIYALAAFSGFVGFALQVLWNRAFAQVHENSVHAFAVVVAVFILALAAGAQVARMFLRRGMDARVLLGRAWFAGGITAACGSWLFLAATHRLTYLPTGGDPFEYAARLAGLAALILFLPITLLGIGLPAILESFARGTAFSSRNADSRNAGSRNAGSGDAGSGDAGSHDADSRDASPGGGSPDAAVLHGGSLLGRVLASNVAGSVLGSVAAGFVLPRILGLWSSILLVALATTLIGLWLFTRLPAGRAAPRWVRPVVATLGLAGAMVVVARLDLPRTRVADNHGERLLAVAEGSHGISAVVERPGSRRLKLNNHYVLGGTASTGDERMASHIPLVVHPNPQRVAFLGVGTGITASGAIFHPTRQIVAIELVPEVMAFAREFFREPNAGVLEDPRTRVVVEDARNYLRGSRHQYDVIVGDLVVPWRQGEGALLTLESFRTVRARLAPGGVYCQWLPLFQLTEDELAMLIRTFVAVFPEAIAWRGDFSPSEPAIGLLAGVEGFELDAAVVSRRLDEMKPDESNPHLEEHVAFWMYCAGVIRAGQATGRLNREDDPWIELAGPLRERKGRLCTDERLRSWLDELYVASEADLARLGEDAATGARAGLLLGRFTAQVEGGDERGAVQTQEELVRLVPERLARMLFP